MARNANVAVTTAVEASTHCPMCHLQWSVRVSASALGAVRNNVLPIQDALPDHAPAERELFLSGICPSCFKALGVDSDEGLAADVPGVAVTLPHDVWVHVLRCIRRGSGALEVGFISEHDVFTSAEFEEAEPLRDQALTAIGWAVVPKEGSLDD